VCAVHSKIKTPNAYVVTDTTQASIRNLEQKLEAQAQQVSRIRIPKLTRCQLNLVLNERVQEKQQTEKGFEHLKKELGEMLAVQFKQLERSRLQFTASFSLITTLVTLHKEWSKRRKACLVN